ncbi:Arm DNA-binding domain-containing protein [Dokdonella soli]|uniref:Integrase DNA-binding domain-containing protein n=1 Tax=Dokdonella soli TaxID=529810 RepID=A0ABN1IE01_9GAMM
MALTDTKLRALKAKATVYRVADANGLAIEVRTNGARHWRYRYESSGGDHFSDFTVNRTGCRPWTIFSTMSGASSEL